MRDMDGHACDVMNMQNEHLNDGGCKDLYYSKTNLLFYTILLNLPWNNLVVDYNL